jgi:hypothetical protein
MHVRGQDKKGYGNYELNLFECGDFVINRFIPTLQRLCLFI